MDEGRSRPPSVERLIAAARPRLGERAHDAVVVEARRLVADERARLAAGVAVRPLAGLAAELVARLEAFERAAGPEPVINATGVIVHTNLGRAPWPRAAIEAATAAASGTLFLELDRATGRRGHRYREAEEHLVALAGGEDALVTNNNAAALALAVGLVGRGRGAGVAVSRGELVEIGGGVRIPEIVRRAGARLVEVGTTNRTRAADFEAVLASGEATVVLRVHPSNFAQAGFVEAPDPRALADAAHTHGALVIDDLGSGALLDTAAFGLAHEPTPRERLADGADLVTFSGDKLVGGPQAGFVVGRADLVARLRKDPLARAMRPDKAMLAAVAATLALYRAGVATREIPVWRRIAARADDLLLRGESIVAGFRIGGVGGISLVETRATVGGGSLPGETLPSWALRLSTDAPDRLLARLRAGTPAVVGRIEDGAVLLDLRTVDPDEDGALGRAVAEVMPSDGAVVVRPSRRRSPRRP